MDIYISREELEKALVQLKEAEKRGFVESQAVFSFARVDRTDIFSSIVDEKDSEFTGELILRSHKTDSSKNWGRVSDGTGFKLKDGECVVD